MILGVLAVEHRKEKNNTEIENDRQPKQPKKKKKKIENRLRKRKPELMKFLHKPSAILITKEFCIYRLSLCLIRFIETELTEYEKSC